MRHYLTRQTMKAIKASVVMLTFFGLAGTAIADKKITFKTPSAFGTNLPITGSTSVYFADVLERVSGGNMKIKMFEPGELMPAFDIHQAVSDGQVQAGYTCGAYLGGSLKEAIPYCTMPFGPEPHVMLGWLYEGNGTKLWEKFYNDAGYNVKDGLLRSMQTKAQVGLPRELKKLKIGKEPKSELVALQAEL